MNMRSNDGLVVLVSEMPIVALRMAPPVQVAADVHVPPAPETVRPPVAPVLFSTIPLAAPFDEMCTNASPLAAIVVLATLSPAPVVESITLFAPWTEMVPPPVALKPTPEVVSMFSPPPVKLIVAPVLLVRLTAFDVPVFKVL